MVKAHRKKSIERSVSDLALTSMADECRRMDPNNNADLVCDELIRNLDQRKLYEDGVRPKDVRCVFGLGSFSYLYDEKRDFNVISPGLRVSFPVFRLNVQRQLEYLRTEARAGVDVTTLAKNCVLADAYTTILEREFGANAWYFHRSPHRNGRVFPTQVWYGKQLSVPGGGPVLDCGTGEWKLNDAPGGKPVVLKMEAAHTDEVIAAIVATGDAMRAVKDHWETRTKVALPPGVHVMMTGKYRARFGAHAAVGGGVHVLSNAEEANFEADAVRHAIENANLRTATPDQFLGSFGYGNGSTQGRLRGGGGGGRDQLVYNETGLKDAKLERVVGELLKSHDPIDMNGIRRQLAGVTPLLRIRP